MPPSTSPAVLEASLARVDEHLNALGDALSERDAAAVDRQAAALQVALAAAATSFAQAARRGGVPPMLRQRFARVSGHVAAQRESLARATAALDQAIDVLMPAGAPRSGSV